MREILFRGKRIDNGEWVEGYLFQVWEESYILWGTTNGIPNMVKVIPESVGQFTGMVDKKGVKIFEDDILQGAYNNEFSKGEIRNYHVRWGVDSWHIMHTRFSMQELFIYCNKNVEVIGNIHDKNY